jgi:thiol:disulfide interchange protein
MHAGIKLIFGIILILIGLWLLVPAGGAFTAIKPATYWGSMFDWWSEFKTVVKGVVPPIIVILGLLIVWIEGEELKSPVVPEVEQATAKPKKGAKKTKKKK